MARRAYKLSSELRALRGLVAYAESTRPAGPALAAIASDGILNLSSDGFRRFKAQSSSEIDNVRQALREFLRSSAEPLAGDRVDPIKEGAVQISRPFTVTQRLVRTPAGNMPQVDGAPRDVTLHFAASLLQQVGTEKLRLCRAPDCRKAFVKVGRREFCSPGCQRRVFLSEYDPLAARPRRGDVSRRKVLRHGKTTRKK